MIHFRSFGLGAGCVFLGGVLGFVGGLRQINSSPSPDPPPHSTATSATKADLTALKDDLLQRMMSRFLDEHYLDIERIQSRDAVRGIPVYTYRVNRFAQCCSHSASNRVVISRDEFDSDLLTALAQGGIVAKPAPRVPMIEQDAPHLEFEQRAKR